MFHNSKSQKKYSLYRRIPIRIILQSMVDDFNCHDVFQSPRRLMILTSTCSGCGPPPTPATPGSGNTGTSWPAAPATGAPGSVIRSGTDGEKDVHFFCFIYSILFLYQCDATEKNIFIQYNVKLSFEFFIQENLIWVGADSWARAWLLIDRL